MTDMTARVEVVKLFVKFLCPASHITYEKGIAVGKAVAASPKDAEASGHSLPTFDANMCLCKKIASLTCQVAHVPCQWHG